MDERREYLSAMHQEVDTGALDWFMGGVSNELRHRGYHDLAAHYLIAARDEVNADYQEHDGDEVMAAQAVVERGTIKLESW